MLGVPLGWSVRIHTLGRRGTPNTFAWRVLGKGGLGVWCALGWVLLLGWNCFLPLSGMHQLGLRRSTHTSAGSFRKDVEGHPNLRLESGERGRGLKGENRKAERLKIENLKVSAMGVKRGNNSVD